MLLIASNACIYSQRWLYTFILRLHQKLTIETIFIHTIRAEISTESTDSLSLLELYNIKRKCGRLETFREREKKEYETYSFKHSIWILTVKKVKQKQKKVSQRFLF